MKRLAVSLVLAAVILAPAMSLAGISTRAYEENCAL
jgi:hypothetical protein